MVFGRDITDEDENKEGQPEGSSTPAVVDGSQAPQTASPTAPAQSGGGGGKPRFTNVASYLQANQKQNLAGGIQQSITGQAQQAQAGVAAQQKKFQEEASKGQEGYTGTSGTYGSGGNYGGKSLDDAAAIVNDPNAYKEIQGAMNAKYQGPKELGNDPGVANNVQQVKNAAAQTQNEAGRFNLLKNTYGKPGYSSGQQKLDQLLLGGDSRAKQLSQNAMAQAQGTSNKYIDAQKTAMAEAQKHVTDADLLAGQTNAAVGKAQKDYMTSLDAKVTQKQLERDNLLSRLKQSFETDSFTPEDLKALNLEEGMDLYGTNFNDYYKASDNKANLSNVADANDYSQVAALSKLMGHPGATYFNDPSQAGTFAKDPYSFDAGALRTGIGEKKAAYENDMMALTKEIAANQAAFDNAKGSLGEDRFAYEKMQQYRAKLAELNAAKNSLPGKYNIGRKITVATTQKDGILSEPSSEPAAPKSRFEGLLR